MPQVDSRTARKALLAALYRKVGGATRINDHEVIHAAVSVLRSESVGDPLWAQEIEEVEQALQDLPDLADDFAGHADSGCWNLLSRLERWKGLPGGIGIAARTASPAGLSEAN